MKRHILMAGVLGTLLSSAAASASAESHSDTLDSDTKILLAKSYIKACEEKISTLQVDLETLRSLRGYASVQAKTDQPEKAAELMAFLKKVHVREFKGTHRRNAKRTRNTELPMRMQDVVQKGKNNAFASPIFAAVGVFDRWFRISTDQQVEQLLVMWENRIRKLEGTKKQADAYISKRTKKLEKNRTLQQNKSKKAK